MSLFGRDVVSARNIPSNIRSSKVDTISEYIKEFTDLVKSIDKSITDFKEYKRSWQSKINPGLDDLRKTLYQSQIVNIDLNIDKLNNYKTKLNKIIDRWNYVKKKNTKSKALFGQLRKLKKDMISDLSKPQKQIKRTKHGKRTQRKKNKNHNRNIAHGGTILAETEKCKTSYVPNSYKKACKCNIDGCDNYYYRSGTKTDLQGNEIPTGSWYRRNSIAKDSAILGEGPKQNRGTGVEFICPIHAKEREEELVQRRLLRETALAGQNIEDLRRQARHAGVDRSKVRAVIEEEGDPKSTIIKLILDAAGAADSESYLVSELNTSVEVGDSVEVGAAANVMWGNDDSDELIPVIYIKPNPVSRSRSTNWQTNDAEEQILHLLGGNDSNL